MMLNAVPVACLMENVLILYAIRNGMRAPLVALMASFMHLSMPFMFFGKQLVARVGLARTWGLCWGLRYLLVSLVILAPLLKDVSSAGVAALLLFGNFGLTVFRSMGLVATTPLVGEVTTDRDRGRFISGNFMYFNVVYFVALLAIIWLLKHWDRLITYQGLIATGCLVGLGGAYVLTTVPETDAARRSARKPVGTILRKILHAGPYRRLLIAWCAGFISFAIIIPFSLMALKQVYGISDYAALTYSLMLVIGGMAGAFINGVIADHVGPRPLVVLYVAGFFLVSLFWALAPAVLIPLAVALSLFLAGFCKQGLIVGLGHYFLNMVPKDDRVGAGLFVRMVSGAAAGIAGGVLGAGLLQLLSALTNSPMTMYRWYFRFALLALAPLLLAMLYLPRLREWSIPDILGLFFSPRDLRAMLVLNRAGNRRNASDDLDNVRKLGAIGSTVSESTLLQHLRSVHLSVRIRALRALGRQPALGPEAQRALRRELENGEFTTAWVAAEVLANKGVREAIPELRNALESEDVFLHGHAMEALTILGDDPSYARIVQSFSESTNPRLLIHGAHALGRMQGPDNVGVLLRKACEDGLPPPVRDEILCVAAGWAGNGERMYRFLTGWRAQPAETDAIAADVLDTPSDRDAWRRLRARAGADDGGAIAIRALSNANNRPANVGPDLLHTVVADAVRNDMLEKFFVCGCLLRRHANKARPPSR